MFLANISRLTEDFHRAEIGHIAGKRVDDICLYVSPANQTTLEAIIKSCNSSSKAAQAEMVLASAGGYGTNEIMRPTSKLKLAVWRRQEHYIGNVTAIEGFFLKKDK